MKKFLSLVMVGIMAAVFFWIFGLYMQSKQASNWPETPGHVVSASLTISHLPSFLNFTADPLRWYGLDVSYEYEVNGGLYTSHRVSINDGTVKNVNTALSVMNQFRKHPAVMVYYNPSNPKDAVLEPGNIGDIFLPFAGIVILMFLWSILFYDNSVEVKTPSVADYLRWGTSCQKQGKIDQALVAFTRIIEISPYITIGYKMRAGIYLEQQKWDDAIYDLNQAMSIDPSDAYIFATRARAFLGKEEYERALQDAERAQDMGFQVDPELLHKIKMWLP